MNNKILVLVGGSGSGKTMVANRLVADYGYKKVITTTTRTPRPGETNGKDYHFISKDEFLDMKNNGRFVEYTEYAGNMYGTSKDEMDSILSGRTPAVIVMDGVGAKFMKDTYGDSVCIAHIFREKRDIILSILKRNIPDEEKAERIAGLDRENNNVCGDTAYDVCVNNNSSAFALAETLDSMFRGGTSPKR